MIVTTRTVPRVIGSLALALAAACGTTVPLTSTATGPGGGNPSLDGQQLENQQGTGPGGSLSGGTTGVGSTGSVGLTSGTRNATSGSTSAGSVGSGGPGASGPGAGQAPGKKPIRIGFLVTDFGSVGKSMGFSSSFDPERGFKDLVVSLNKSGGLAGRRIQPDYYAVDPSTSGTGDQASQTACTHLTQDQHDELVVSADIYSATLDACLLAAHTPHIDAGYTYSPDAAEPPRRVRRLPSLRRQRSLVLDGDGSEPARPRRVSGRRSTRTGGGG